MVLVIRPALPVAGATCQLCGLKIVAFDGRIGRDNNLIHVTCGRAWRVLVTGGQIRESRRRGAKSPQQLVASNRRVDAARETPTRTVCVICGKPISTLTKCIRSNDGPMHTGCAG